jgi:antagonist of KipI
MLTTVQDLGREGYGPAAVSPSGAADPVALRLGNRLVGNSDSAAALEMTLLGGTFRFPDGAFAALAGSDFSATLNGAAVQTWSSFEIRSGETLRLGSTANGARCYLCFAGGIAAPLLLGSASTHLLSGTGGWEGRALRTGDLLPIGANLRPFRKRRISAGLIKKLTAARKIRVTSGPQANWFSASSLRTFYSEAYRVGDQSNRMGLRLQGPALTQRSAREMITEGVSLGAVQVTSGGMPIILFVEQQTTGGYPKIANVISADLHRIGQLCPHDEIQFEQVSLETARRLLSEQETLLASEVNL